jgi:hypothetical protein
MKQDNGKKVVSIACMALFLISVIPHLSGQPVINETSDNYTERFVVQFSPQDLSFSRLNGYDLVTLNGCDFLNEVGKPQVPVQYIKIAVPAGMRIQQASVEHVQIEHIPGHYKLYPAQQAIPTNDAENSVRFIQPDTTYFTSSQPYPSQWIEFAGETDLAGQPIGEFIVYPVQYVASEKTLTLATSITFVVTGVSGYTCGDYLPKSISDEGRATYESMIKDMVINPEDVQVHSASDEHPASLAIPPGGPYSHVIITTDALSSYWAPLVEWHTKRGLKDTVVTTEYIYGHYSGTTNQLKIRNFVIDAYNSWGTLYFFMAGETTSVPLEYRTYYQDSTPSDQYYSDFDDDWTHEVFVGRVTANNAAEIGVFLDKLLFYEKTPLMTDYLLKAGLFGFDLDGSTHGSQLMETISSYIPTRFTKTKVYDSYGGSHLSAVTNALNSGQHLVAHADHGDFDWWGVGYINHGTGMYSSAVDALTNNNKMSIVSTLACDVNGFDSLDTCFSEHWVMYTGNPMQAGLAFNGNTRLGYGYIGNPQSLSCQLVRDWWQGLFIQNKYVLGETIIWSKHQFPTTGQDAALKQHCEWEFSLLGEPSIPIWTDTPLSLDVNYPARLPNGPSSFTVHVTSGSTPVSQAYVCLWKGTEVYLTGNTNANGDITFNPSPVTAGTMYVTATKQNYLPYEGSAEVSVLPVVITNDTTNVEETTATMNGFLQFNGSFDTTCWFVWDIDSGEPYANNESQGIVPSGTRFSRDLTGLVEGELYYVNTKANNTLGWNNSGREKTFLTKPLLPTALTAQANSSTMIYLSWTVPASADTTVIERSDIPAWTREQGIEIYNGTGTNYENSGLQPLCHYYYETWSYCAEGGMHQYSDTYGESNTTTLAKCGDVNNDGTIDVSDVVYLINYLFTGGSPPQPPYSGDCNGDTVVDVGDVVYLINYLFLGGPAPGGCCG